jgi:hypothetical protein
MEENNMNSKKGMKKLSLNKKTITNLIDNAMDEAKGGKITVPVPKTNMTVCYCSWVYSCDFATCSPSWCGDQCV